MEILDEFQEFHDNLDRKWQKRAYKSACIGFAVIFAVELLTVISYSIMDSFTIPVGIHVLIRLIVPVTVNLLDIIITGKCLKSTKISVRKKNYIVTECVIILCMVVSVIHNFYFVLWIAPAVALFFATIFNDYKLLNISYVSINICLLITLAAALAEANFSVVDCVMECVIAAAIFMVCYFVCRKLVSQQKKRLEYIGRDMDKNRETMEKLDIEPMSRLLNRKAFDRDVVEAVKTNQKSGREKAIKTWIAIFDIDFFKKINDSYGHICGDEVICTIANLLKKHIGDRGKVYRYGGEEFVVILDQCTMFMAYTVVEGIRMSVEECRFSFDPDKKVTVSAGLAGFKEGMDAVHWLGEADKLLYKAKNAGRNKIEMKN